VTMSASADGNCAVIRVRDTGIGIDAEVLPQVFEAFAQADRSLDRTPGGLGLGLAIVKGLVELHGGSVRADSAGLGRGAEFVLSLPLADAPNDKACAPAGGRPVRRERLRVMVVDDNRDSADSLRQFLEIVGHEAAVAYSGPDALAAAVRFRPHAVVCDIGLPGLDGYGVAAALRADPATAGARLIALTGYSAASTDRARAAGFDVYLIKPVPPATLLDHFPD
jgi:CheY-like chemotaxis protein